MIADTILKILRKRFLKIVPIWLLVLLAGAGIAVASFTWISNQVYTSVTVSDIPIKIAGEFNIQAYVGLQSSSDFTYTITSSTAPTGYMQIRLAGTFSDVSDCEVFVSVNPTGGSGENLGFAAAPSLVGSQIILLFGGQGSTASVPTPIEFGSTGGSIQVLVTYVNANTIGTVDASMQVTSTLN